VRDSEKTEHVDVVKQKLLQTFPEGISEEGRVVVEQPPVVVERTWITEAHGIVNEEFCQPVVDIQAVQTREVEEVFPEELASVKLSQPVVVAATLPEEKREFTVAMTATAPTWEIEQRELTLEQGMGTLTSGFTAEIALRHQMELTGGNIETQRDLILTRLPDQPRSSGEVLVQSQEPSSMQFRDAVERSVEIQDTVEGIFETTTTFSL